MNRDLLKKAIEINKDIEGAEHLLKQYHVGGIPDSIIINSGSTSASTWRTNVKKYIKDSLEEFVAKKEAELEAL